MFIDLSACIFTLKGLCKSPPDENPDSGSGAVSGDPDEITSPRSACEEGGIIQITSGLKFVKIPDYQIIRLSGISGFFRIIRNPTSIAL